MTNALTNKPVTMSSREIAELTGKRHGDVIRDIRNMLAALGDDANLRHVREETDSRGYTAAFHLPRREVEILLTGYSIPLRAKVIDRLHELEEQAKGDAFRVPQSLPERPAQGSRFDQTPTTGEVLRGSTRQGFSLRNRRPCEGNCDGP